MQKKINYQFKMKQKYKRQQLAIAVILIVCLLSLVIIFARYLTNNVKDFFVRSKEFYFYSDKLTEDTSVYQIDNWSGVDDYVITINMNSRKNNLKVTSYDIGYNISYTCSDNAICQLSKTEGNVPATTNADSFNLTITPNRQLDTGDKVVVEIEVNSTAQYKKTLKGKFTLVVGKEKLSYQITDSSQNPYMELSITNTLSYYVVNEAFDSYTVGQKIDIDTYLGLSEEKRKKCYSSIVTIKFKPREILFDVTNNSYEDATNIKTEQINGKTYINELTISIDAISSVNLRFYKVDVSKDYTYPNNNNSSVVTVTSI